MNQEHKPTPETNSLSPRTPLVRKWWFLSLLISGSLLLLLLVIFYWGWQNLYLPITDSNGQVTLKVEEGQSVDQIIDQLKMNNLIRSSFWLKIIARFEDPLIKAGLYYLSPIDNAMTILEKLSSGKISEKQLTLPEGWRTEQIAQRLEANKIIKNKLEFYQQILNSKDFDQLKNRLEAPANAPLEGWLFPDTYRFATDQEVSKVIKKIIDNFESKTKDLTLNYQELIIASIVEREAIFDEDRAKIAGVYVNRMQANIRLEADPTVQYAKANNLNPDCFFATKFTATNCDKVEWWSEITTTDYQSIESNFNTYLISGLPPHPIANPGLASIKAAINPAQHNFYYFLTDSAGHAHFARTLTEHNQNKRKYLR